MPAVAMLRRLRLDVQQAGVKTPDPASVPAAVPESEAQAVNADQSEQSPLADLAAIVAESDSKKPLRCPECEKMMRKDRYQQMIPVMVDRCKQCDRIWLDTGELHLLRRLYFELATSSDPQIVSLREKVAMVSMDWHTRPPLTQQPVPDSVSNAAEFADLAQLVLRLLIRM